jgi:hypothetical protein
MSLTVYSFLFIYMSPMLECSFRGRIAEWRDQLLLLAHQLHTQDSFL